MIKRILFSILFMVISFGAYFYGYNVGSRDEAKFIRIIVVPLCNNLSSNQLDLFKCIEDNI